MKPFTCKVWPFIVTNEPKSGDRHSSLFQHKGKEYYVYLNPHASVCSGVNRGKPEVLELTISEVIEIYQDPLKNKNTPLRRKSFNLSKACVGRDAKLLLNPLKLFNLR
jgi:hypothetical protein